MKVLVGIYLLEHLANPFMCMLVSSCVLPTRSMLLMSFALASPGALSPTSTTLQQQKSMDCVTDFVAVIVYAILLIGGPSSVEQVHSKVAAMCPGNVTPQTVEYWCTEAVRRGVAYSDKDNFYGLRNDMVLQDARNAKYWSIVKANRAVMSEPHSSVVLFDDFSHGFQFCKWFVIKKQFGPNNGGIVPLNVHIRDNQLVLTGNGDKYKGDVVGVKKNGGQYDYTSRKTRVGGGIFSQQYFGSGTFSVRARVLPFFGAYSAFWTFWYGEDGADITNHEIDIETPGRNGVTQVSSFDYLLGNTFVTERDVQTNYINQRGNTLFALNDGLFHTYTIDWYAGSESVPPRVNFYVDSILVGTNTKHVPTIAGRFWIAIWFPDQVAGTPNFEQGDMVVDWVKITSNPSPRDQYEPETYPKDGIAPMKELDHLRPV